MYNRRCRKCCSKCNYSDNMIENININMDMNNNQNNTFDDDYNSCDCGYNEVKSESLFPENPMFGQSYVPIQKMDKTFIPCVGLKMGTIFPELVSPYSPCQSMEENAFIKAMNTVGEGCNKC